MKMLNNKEPSIDPYGTPVSVSCHELKHDPIFVLFAVCEIV